MLLKQSNHVVTLLLFLWLGEAVQGNVWKPSSSTKNNYYLVPVSPLFVQHQSSSFSKNKDKNNFVYGGWQNIARGGGSNIANNDDEAFNAISSSDAVSRGGSTTTIRRPAQTKQHNVIATPPPQQQHDVTPRPENVPSAHSAITSSFEEMSFSNTTTTATSIHGTEEKSATPTKPLKFHKMIAKKLKNRNHTNIRRKLLHTSWGFIFAALNHVLDKSKFIPGMTVLTTATLVMELLRYRPGFAWMNKALHFTLGDSLRKDEMNGKFTGSFYYFLGVTLTATLYSKAAATLGIIQLAIADPAASYFGRATRNVYWSRIDNGLGGFGRNKGVLGFLGGAMACVPFNYRLLSIATNINGALQPVGQSTLLAASMVLGLAGAFADLAVPTPALTLPKRVCGVRVPPFHVDDNLVVPVVSGYACTKMFQVLGWSQDLQLANFLFF